MEQAVKALVKPLGVARNLLPGEAIEYTNTPPVQLAEVTGEEVLALLSNGALTVTISSAQVIDYLAETN